ncbi:MAG: class I SAM-dependent methyltransferase [Chloroflexi bacterium]|nr:class I SAM-dependent methyltransferase [Chloroflexota bacterium]
MPDALEYSAIEHQFQQVLDNSLDPRGPESLYDVVAGLRLAAGATAVDVGCGEGDDALELVKRFGFRVQGVDPEPRNVDVARARAAGMRDRAEFQAGVAEALPFDDESVDLLWCKEVITLTDLQLAFKEFARVLRPGGRGMVYQVLTGPRMTDTDAREFWELHLGYGHARSVRPADVERSIAPSGLQLVERVDFGSEWGEYAQERSGAGGRRLMHAARLLRQPQRYIDEFGEDAYRIMLGDCLWHVYRMIGKLHGVAFVFRKPASL